jgi:hypothetical protein
MTSASPTIDQALPGRRFLLSAWPWRSAAYLLTTLVAAVPVAGAVWLLLLPWLAAAANLRDGELPTGTVIVLMAIGAALLVGFAPLVAVPLAAVERRRLALIDPRPVLSGHLPAPADPGAWLRLRYREAATWREVAYGLVLAVAVPIAYSALALAWLVDAALLLSPLVINDSDAGPWVILGHRFDSVGQSPPSRGPGWSTRSRRNGGASSGTCTTAPSTSSPASPCTSAWPAWTCPRTPPPPGRWARRTSRPRS